MVSFRNGILKIEKNSGLNSEQSYRFAYEICLSLGFICYYPLNLKVLHYFGTALFIASALIITLWKTKTSRINKPMFSLWYLWFFVLCELSSIWAYAPVITASKYFKMQMLILIIGFGIIQYVDTRKDIERLFDLYIFSALATALIQFAGTPYKKWFAGYFGGAVGLNNSNNFGYIVLFAAVIAFNKAYNQKKPLNYILVIFFLFCCVISSSRKAIAVALFGIIAVILFSFKRKHHIIHFFTAVALAFVILMVLLNNEFFYHIIGYRIKTLFRFLEGNYSSAANGSLQLRDFYIYFARKNFEKHPILGNGFVSFHSILVDQTDNMGTGYAHNNYWEVLSDLGLVGFISYYWLYAYILYRLIVSAVKKGFDNIQRLGCIMFISELILEWGVVTLYQPFCQIIIAFIFLCCCKNNSQKKFYYSGQKKGGL